MISIRKYYTSIAIKCPWDFQTNFLGGFKMMSFHFSQGNGQPQVMTPLPKMIDIRRKIPK